MIKRDETWAQAQLYLALKEMGVYASTGNIKKIAFEKENAVIDIRNNTFKDIKERRAAEREACTIFENENVRIYGLIDYDFGYSMLKYRVTYKATGECIGNAEMIEKLD